MVSKNSFADGCEESYLLANIVTTSVALVTTSDALVPSSFLLKQNRRCFLHSCLEVNSIGMACAAVDLLCGGTAGVSFSSTQRETEEHIKFP